MTDRPEPIQPARVARRPVGQLESVRAQRTWWDAAADDYLAEHGDFLGDARFVWGPEGLAEADAHEAAAELLRRAQAHHPSDVWLNFDLAGELEAVHPPRTDEAIGYFRAARALRGETGHELAHAPLAHREQRHAARRVADHRPRHRHYREQRDQRREPPQAQAYLGLREREQDVRAHAATA